MAVTPWSHMFTRASTGASRTACMARAFPNNLLESSIISCFPVQTAPSNMYIPWCTSCMCEPAAWGSLQVTILLHQDLHTCRADSMSCARVHTHTHTHTRARARARAPTSPPTQCTRTHTHTHTEIAYHCTATHPRGNTPLIQHTQTQTVCQPVSLTGRQTDAWYYRRTFTLTAG
jgi:hypothetical protein